MLTFSRGQRGQARPVDLESVVRESLQMLSATLPANMEVSIDCAPGLPPVEADPLHLQQVLMNLCINARDAIEGEGRIDVAISRRRVDNALCTACHQATDGDWLLLTCTDTGAGIAPDTLDRVFEPFFSTKETGRGSGMGLAVVHGIVHEYGGHITVVSGPAAGTRFEVLLPPAEGAGNEHVPTEAAGTRSGSARLSGHVVVCEDDAQVAEFIHEQLLAWGLKVTVFEHPAAALAHCRADRVDLMLVDYSMPGMNGLELAQAVLARQPHLPALLYTGNSEGIDEDMATAAGLRGLLRKPLDIPGLRQRLVSLLAG